jgi:V-type H+-transporting ATPase subunit d
MSRILSFEADRRTINITVNSLGTQLTKEQRASLFPTIGRLYPAGNNALARADEIDQIKAVVEYIPEYREFFTPTHSSGSLEDDDSPHAAAESLEDHFFRASVRCFDYWTELIRGIDRSTSQQAGLLATM